MSPAAIVPSEMWSLSAVASRMRVVASRLLVRLGFQSDSFLLLLAVVVGIITAAAAVMFHKLINKTRDLLYLHVASPKNLYGHKGILLLILFPAVGGLVVGLVSRFVFRTREGHGIVDVMESVVRSSGFIRPVAAVEKIITAGITIGTGGSAGAEGPIVQIGAAIASGVGQLFRVSRAHMPLLIGCGTAAGISAIFNSPIGGVLFALEVILFDFSMRTFTPVVMASVIANVTTKVIFSRVFDEHYEAIFALNPQQIGTNLDISFSQIPIYLGLGVLCGIVGVSLTRMMYFSERRLSLRKVPKALRPAVGGAAVGVMGVLYIVIFGWGLLHSSKPFAFEQYPMPAFFGDGYGVIRRLFEPDFYSHATGPQHVILLLAFLCIAKVLATCLTLSTGGSGGIIAPSLFLGATAGGLLGLLLQRSGIYHAAQPEVCAMVGMAAVLAAVVHAPLASILILSDLTHDYKIVLPAMLATIIATGVARLIFRDSIYTLTLRLRGVRVGASADLTLLRRLNVEQIPLEPAIILQSRDPFQRVVDLISEGGAADFAVVDESGEYQGMVTTEEIQIALIDREAVPLLLVQDVMRRDVPIVNSSDDLAVTLDIFSRHEVEHLPVCISRTPAKVIGLLSRHALMRRYQQMLQGT
jgi:CIC family chloride channel protein